MPQILHRNAFRLSFSLLHCDQFKEKCLIGKAITVKCFLDKYFAKNLQLSDNWATSTFIRCFLGLLWCGKGS